MSSGRICHICHTALRKILCWQLQLHEFHPAPQKKNSSRLERIKTQYCFLTSFKKHIYFRSKAALEVVCNLPEYTKIFPTWFKIGSEYGISYINLWEHCSFNCVTMHDTFYVSTSCFSSETLIIMYYRVFN